jgi:hypothetical protein
VCWKRSGGWRRSVPSRSFPTSAGHILASSSAGTAPTGSLHSLTARGRTQPDDGAYAS